MSREGGWPAFSGQEMVKEDILMEFLSEKASLLINIMKEKLWSQRKIRTRTQGFKEKNIFNHVNGGLDSSGRKKIVSCSRRRRFSGLVIGVLLVRKVSINVVIIPNVKLPLLLKTQPPALPSITLGTSLPCISLQKKFSFRPMSHVNE